MGYELEVCNEKHNSLECRMKNTQWIFGIVITLQLACFSFTGWLSAKTLGIELDQTRQNYRIENIEKEINDKLSVIITNGNKLDKILKKIGE